MTSLVQRALQPLDVVRGGLLRTVVGVPAGRRLMATRATRVPLLLALHAVVAFALAVFVPSLTLALVPIFLGVPHLVSDVRHLVLRRALPRWWVRAIVGFAAALLLLRVIEAAHLARATPIVLEHAVGSVWIFVAALGGTLLGRRWLPAFAALTFTAAVTVLALAVPHPFRVAFVHGHNVLAIVIWLWLFRRRLSLAGPLAGLLLIGGAVLASGLLLGVTVNSGALSLFGLHLFAAADWIAPGLPDRWALGLTTAFAFLQSVHYAIWLVAIPQEDARVDGTTTFRMAWRGLARDLGGGALSIVVLVALAVLVGGLVALARTRVLLLSLATFHAWGELALLAFFLARDGLSPSPSPSSTAIPP